jgi:DNA repair protein RadC
MNVGLTAEQKIKISNSDDIFEIMRRILMRENRLAREKEHFIGLNIRSRILYIELVSLGNQAQSIVDPMEVFQLAVLKKSPYVILVHNHPSGELSPSSQDREITKKLRSGGELLNIEILDHLIVSEDDYLSFRDRGWIRPKKPNQ